MNALIIYTHPNHKSLNYAMYQAAYNTAKTNPNITDIRTIDLYQEDFDPRLVFNETKRRRDMHTDAEMAPYREAITWADHITFVYPIWWGRPPAMLLGFIDKLFATNFAYKYTGKLMPEGLLKGKTVVCISTMKGPTGYPKFFLNNAHKALMKKALFSFVGIKKVKFFEFGSSEKKEGPNAKNITKIKRHYSAL